MKKKLSKIETEDAILLRPVASKAEVVDEGGWLALKPAAANSQTKKAKKITLDETLEVLEKVRTGRDHE